MGFKLLITGLGSIIGAPRSGVRDVLFTRLPIQSKIEISEEHSPTGLTTVKDLRCHEIFQILVVANDGDGEGRTDEPGAHVAETFDDSEKFFVVHVVVDFLRRDFPRVERNGVQFIILVRLLKNSRQGEVGGIGSEGAGKTRVEVA